MNDLEQRLRDAYRAAAATVRPDSVRGLHEFRVHAPRVRHRRWILGSGLAAPLGAAVAVAALVLAVAMIVPTLTMRHGGAVATEPGARIPQFTLADEGSDLRVIQTVTGRVVGKVSAPAGLSFTDAEGNLHEMAGTANDRTFFVLASPVPFSCRAFLYKVQLGPGGQPSLIRLPVTLPAGTGIPALAASGDGRTAALLLSSCGKLSPDASAMQANGGIVLVDLATGRLIRQWSYGPNEVAQIPPSGPYIYLSADGGQLAFPVYQKSTPQDLTVRMLATSAPSGTLDSASHVAWRQPQGYVMAAPPPMALSPDGKTLYACAGPLSRSSISITLLLAFSATTGRQIRVLHTWAPSRYVLCGVVTTDPLSGSLLAYVDSRMTGTATRPSRRSAATAPYPGTYLFAVDPATGRASALPFSLPADGLAW
jgi:hypothetical protein